MSSAHLFPFQWCALFCSGTPCAHLCVCMSVVLAVIEEGNWLTLMDTDIEFPEDGFDAVVCLGNSFAHLPDSDGSQAQHRRALRNFADAVKPGGILLIDHRNYDAIIDTGTVFVVSCFWGTGCKVCSQFGTLESA